MKRKPLLAYAADKVSIAIASARSIYTPVRIDIGPMRCPCRDEPMVLGSIDDTTIVCPECGSKTARSLGIHSIVILAEERIV